MSHDRNASDRKPRGPKPHDRDSMAQATPPLQEPMEQDTAPETPEDGKPRARRDTAYPLLPLLRDDSLVVLRNLEAALEQVLPLRPKHREELPVAIRELSALLTTERSALAGSYLQSPKTLTAYAHYFLPWNVYRQARLLAGQWLRLHSGSRILDLGSGPLTGLTALWAARPDLRSKELSFTCVDRSRKALRLGLDIFRALGGTWSVELVDQPLELFLRQHRPPADLVLLGNVLNELRWPSSAPLEIGVEELAEQVLEQAAQERQAHVLLVEPGTRFGGKLTSLFRQACLPFGYMALSPCTHQEQCPMLERQVNSWCHFRCETTGIPGWLQKLSDAAKLPKESLALSFVHLAAVQAKQGDQARVLSDPIRLPERGASGYYACASLGLMLIEQQRPTLVQGELTDYALQPGPQHDPKTGIPLAELPLALEEEHSRRPTTRSGGHAAPRSAPRTASTGGDAPLTRAANPKPDQRASRRPDQRQGQRPDQRPDQRSDQRQDQRQDRRPDPREGRGPEQRQDQRPDRRPDQPTDQRPDRRPDKRNDQRFDRRPGPESDRRQERRGPAADRPRERGDRRPEGFSDQRRSQGPDRRPTERPGQRQDQRPGQRSGDRPAAGAERRSDQRSGKPFDKRSDQRPDKRFDPRTEKGPGTRGDKPFEKRSDQRSGKTFDKRTDKPFEKRSDQRSGKPFEKRTDKRSDKPFDQRYDQRSDQRPDKRTDQRPGKRSDKPFAKRDGQRRDEWSGPRQEQRPARRSEQQAERPTRERGPGRKDGMSEQRRPGSEGPKPHRKGQERPRPAEARPATAQQPARRAPERSEPQTAQTRPVAQGPKPTQPKRKALAPRLRGNTPRKGRLPDASGSGPDQGGEE